MKRNYLYLALVCFALVLILLFLLVRLNPQAPREQVGYIPPPPPSAAPIVPSPTPTPTSTRMPTWTPTATFTFVPTLTATPSSTATVVSASPTATLGPDANTRGDAPTSAPGTGGETDPNLAVVIGLLMATLTFVSGGGIARYADKWQWFHDWKPSDPNYKMLAVYAGTLAIGALLTWLVNYAMPTWWGIIPAWAQWLLLSVAMFVTSQQWHANEKAAQAKLDAIIHE